MDEFIKAIRYGDIGKFHKLLDNYQFINSPNIYGKTLLYYAAMYESVEIINILLNNKADTNIENSSDYSDFQNCDYDYRTHNEKVPLYLAIKNNNKRIIKLLVLNGANPNIKYNGMTLLYRATLDRDMELIQFLLEKGADIELLNDEISDYFIEYIVNYNYDNNFFILHQKKSTEDLIFEINDINLFKIFLKNGGSINERLIQWLLEEDLKSIEEFIQYGIDINLLFYFAVLNQRIDIIKPLLNYEIDVNTEFIGYGKYHFQKGYTPLKLAIENENIEIISLLLVNNANPNLFNSLALACKEQNLKIVKLLIEYKADTNYAGYEGRTALFDAIDATKANREIISFLIKNGANIYKEDDRGITPLSFAQTNKKRLVKVLTEHEEVTLSKNQDSNIVVNYQTLSNKILEQNKVINKLKDEVKTIKNSDEDNKIEELKLQIDAFGETILSQSNEIKELQDKLISKEENTKNLMDNLILKVNKLEKKLNKHKVVKTKIPINIPVENHSIKKDDGVIVKRESFDDF